MKPENTSKVLELVNEKKALEKIYTYMHVPGEVKRFSLMFYGKGDTFSMSGPMSNHFGKAFYYMIEKRLEDIDLELEGL